MAGQRRWMVYGVPWLLASAVAAFAFMPICDLSFDCGCRWPGFGGHTHCNINHSGPPDCPWCAHTWMGFAAMVFSCGLGLAAIISLPLRSKQLTRVAVGTAVVLGAMVVAGVVTAWALGLPMLAGW